MCHANPCNPSRMRFTKLFMVISVISIFQMYFRICDADKTTTSLWAMPLAVFRWLSPCLVTSSNSGRVHGDKSDKPHLISSVHVFTNKKNLKLQVLKQLNGAKKNIWSPHLALGRFHTRPPKSVQSTTSMFDSQFVFSFTRLMSQPEFGLRSGYPIFHLLNPSTQSVLRCHVPCIRHCRTQSTLESWQNDAQKLNKHLISDIRCYQSFNIPTKRISQILVNIRLNRLDNCLP